VCVWVWVWEGKTYLDDESQKFGLINVCGSGIGVRVSVLHFRVSFFIHAHIYYGLFFFSLCNLSFPSSCRIFGNHRRQQKLSEDIVIIQRPSQEPHHHTTQKKTHTHRGGGSHPPTWSRLQVRETTIHVSVIDWVRGSAYTLAEK